MGSVEYTDPQQYLDGWPLPDLRRTRARELVLRALRDALQDDRHIDAETLYQSVLMSGASISLASVYRSLTEFEEMGLIQVHAFTGLRKVYELDVGQSHDHLVNVDTGEIRHLPARSMDACCTAVATEQRVEIVRRSVTLYVRDDLGRRRRKREVCG
jgi:Fur family transcriptional regulator, ferric uptake regulator